MLTTGEAAKLTAQCGHEVTNRQINYVLCKYQNVFPNRFMPGGSMKIILMTEEEFIAAWKLLPHKPGAPKGSQRAREITEKGHATRKAKKTSDLYCVNSHLR
mgnify:CR=1 FL=1